ncbi:MAG: sigma-70 family RNA polymerase sigma factor [Planctomycetota bacterium]
MAPHPHTVEHLFSTFAQSGDAAALSAVFERTSPGLLALAMQLCDDPAQAEDAVQASFVTAMQKAREFDPTRPLQAWLVGILQLHCKALRARARRTPDPTRLPEPIEPSAADEAHRREVHERLRREIENLPSAYRTVVVLRLLHGMEPAAIAHALGEAPGTVRVRLHRGLTMLRERLPRGIRAACAFGTLEALAPERGMATVGRAVLQRAKHFAPLSPALPLLTLVSLSMKKIVFGVVATAVLTLGTWSLWKSGSDHAAPVTAPVPETSAAMTTGTAAPKSAAHAADADAPTDRDVRTNVGSTIAEGARGRGIRILARGGDGKSARAGIGFTVLPHDGRHPDLHARRIATDRDGLAVFGDLEPGRYGIYPDRAVRVPEEPAATKAEPDAAASLVLVDGFTAHSSTGIELAPVIMRSGLGEEARVLLDLSEVFIRQPRTVSFTGDVSTRLTDVAVFRGETGSTTAPPVKERKDLSLSGDLPDRPPFLVVDVLEGFTQVEVLVDTGVTLEGTVVDSAKSPTTAAEVWLVRDGGRTAFPIARTDDQGRFSLTDIEQGSGIFARMPGHSNSPTHVIGSADAVELVLGPRAALISGTVTDAKGQPVAGARVRIGDPDGDQGMRMQIDTDDHGSFQAPSPAVGDLPVLVIARGFQPWLGVVRVDAVSAAPLAIALTPGARLIGNLRGTDGESCPNRRVVARSPDCPELDVRTGDDGQFLFECLVPGEVTLSVEENDRYQSVTSSHFVTLTSEAQVDLRAVPWSRLAGRVTDASGAPIAGAKLVARPNSDRAEPVATRTDDEGKFEMKTLPDVAYTLRVAPDAPNHRRATVRTGSGGSFVIHFGEMNENEHAKGHRVIEIDWLGVLRGDRRELEIALPMHCVPSAHLRGRVLTADSHPLGGSLVIEVDGTERRVRLQEDGGFAIGPVVPGDYRFRIDPKDDGIATFDLPVTSLQAGQSIDLGSVFVPSRN